MTNNYRISIKSPLLHILIVMSDDKIRELKEGYDNLFRKYNENKDNLRDNIGSRKQVLTTLSNLETVIENEELAKKNRYVPAATVDNSQDIQKEIQMLSGMILKSKNISANDNAFHTKLVGDFTDFQYLYYLYKKDDGLYYKIDKQLRENIDKKIVPIVEQKKIDTLFEESNKGSTHVSNILEILKEYVDVNNIPETSQTSMLSKVSGFLSKMNPLQKPTAKGGKRIAAHAASAYKSTGDKVLLFIDNKKLHRSIYVKGKAKYCKINNEFVLLSKLKNKIITI